MNKICTDIPQSKRLAEILSLESADMCFNISQRSNMPPLMIPYSKFNEFFNIGETPDFLIPCWSLSALLDVLPKVIDRDYVINITQNSTNTWFITYDLFADRDCSFNGLISKSNSFVGACVEMIIKLKKLNLL